MSPLLLVAALALPQPYVRAAGCAVGEAVTQLYSEGMSYTQHTVWLGLYNPQAEPQDVQVTLAVEGAPSRRVLLLVVPAEARVVVPLHLEVGPDRAWATEVAWADAGASSLTIWDAAFTSAYTAVPTVRCRGVWVSPYGEEAS